MIIFPYGKAPFWMLVIAVTTGILSLISSFRHKAEKPDLVMALFSKEHYETYTQVVPEFEKEHGVKIQMQLAEKVAKLSKNSSNSSKPPSSDIVKPPKPKRLDGPHQQSGQPDYTGNFDCQECFFKVFFRRHRDKQRLFRSG